MKQLHQAQAVIELHNRVNHAEYYFHGFRIKSPFSDTAYADKPLSSLPDSELQSIIRTTDYSMDILPEKFAERLHNCKAITLGSLKDIVVKVFSNEVVDVFYLILDTGVYTVVLCEDRMFYGIDDDIADALYDLIKQGDDDDEPWLVEYAETVYEVDDMGIHEYLARMAKRNCGE